MSSRIPGSGNLHQYNTQWFRPIQDDEEEPQATAANISMPDLQAAPNPATASGAASAMLDEEAEEIDNCEADHAAPGAPAEEEDEDFECKRLDYPADIDWARPEGVIIGEPGRIHREPETALEIACWNGDLSVVQAILESHPQALEIEDNWSLFMFAAENGQLETCQFLLDRVGSEIIIEDALSLAAKVCRIEICKMCIELGNLDPNSQGGVQEPPISVALKRGHFEIARYLYEQGASQLNIQIALQQAIQDDETDLVLDIVQSCKEALTDEDLDQVFNEDQGHVDCTGAPLAYAARLGDRKICRALVECGANLEQTGEPAGFTPFLEAIFCAGVNHPICQDLLDLGADVDAKHSLEGQTSMIHAVIRRKTKLCQKLFDWGADINAEDDEGRTPLMYAANYGYRDLCEWLLTHGARLDAVDKKGLTALMHTSSKPLWSSGSFTEKPKLDAATKQKRAEIAALLMDILVEV